MSDIYEEIVNLKRVGNEGVLVTVVEKEGHGPAGVGGKMLVLPDGTKKGTVGGGALEHAAARLAAQLLDDKKNCMKKYLLGPENEILDGEKTGMMCGGAVTLFYEYIGSGERLYIFGAGHIGKALVYHLKNLNYYITLLDNREGMVEGAESAGSAGSVQCRITSTYDTVMEGKDVPPGGFFIIATHSHALDYVVLKRIYKAGWDPKYIGLIASKKKSPALIQRLKDELGNDIDLDNLYSPVGLDIGGQNPDEIAISIISELQAVRYDKQGHKHMRKR